MIMKRMKCSFRTQERRTVVKSRGSFIYKLYTRVVCALFIERATRDQYLYANSL